METDYYNDNWYDEQYEIDDDYGDDDYGDSPTDSDEYVMNEDDCAVEPDAYLDSSWED